LATVLGRAPALIGTGTSLGYTVSQRTREFGIHISIGARRGDVLKLILGQTVVLAAIGVTGGLVAALAMTRFAANLLYGISPADPVTFTSIAALLFTVALLAGYFPARRATRIDPTIALRTE
jgi:putative ABC transport system permease protein